MKPRPQRTKAPAYRQAFERLDEALARSSEKTADARIVLARIGLFGDAPDSPPPGVATDSGHQAASAAAASLRGNPTKSD